MGEREQDTKIHLFQADIRNISLPQKFTYPFQYTPHPLIEMAAEEVKAYLLTRPEWKEEIGKGKMFGVLLVRMPDGRVGYIAAFSGNLAGSNKHDFFVPPIYDLLHPDGFFRKGEAEIGVLTGQIGAVGMQIEYSRHLYAEKQERAREEIESAKRSFRDRKQARDARRKAGIDAAEEQQLIAESQFQKAELARLRKRWRCALDRFQNEVKVLEAQEASLKERRKATSEALQIRIFKEFRILNANGEEKDLCELFRDTPQGFPPAGAGECALPKLLQYAYLHALTPLAMGEFWQGKSPKQEIRKEGCFYPSCTGKCKPILQHALIGLEVEPNPQEDLQRQKQALEIVYEDPWIVVVNKPPGMLSVTGKYADGWSVQRYLAVRYPDATGPLLVHRLDMATSGLLLVAKDKETHRRLQQQFEARRVKKRYTALLEGNVGLPDEGIISLPLAPLEEEMFRRKVDREKGKEAITRYRIIERTDAYTRISFFPETGRTHQLRVHAAHPEGLNHPIIGDGVYGTPGKRMYLHAASLEFVHPTTGVLMRFYREADF